MAQGCSSPCVHYPAEDTLGSGLGQGAAQRKIRGIFDPAEDALPRFGIFRQPFAGAFFQSYPNWDGFGIEELFGRTELPVFFRIQLSSPPKGQAFPVVDAGHAG